MKTFVALTALLILAACGQTGPLRLPEPKPAAAEPAAVPASDAEKTKPSPTP